MRKFEGAVIKKIALVIIVGGLVLAAAVVFWRLASREDAGQQFVPTGEPAAITIDYPAVGSIFPPEFPPPTFLWNDPDDNAVVWKIDVTFEGGSVGLSVESPGDPMSIGEIDERCISSTNELPKLTPEQAAGHSWKPDVDTWTAIKKRSTERPATVTITGFSDQDSTLAVSRGQVSIKTSTDPVGAPIFYRDVPLMPAETEKGVIKPLAGEAVPLIGWRLLNVGETRSRLLMEGLYSCTNCHSFSRDGKTMGMDVDGPQNDKGLYAIVPVKPQMSIRNQDVVAWSTFRGKLGGRLRVGFMSQVSPEGQYVVTTINDPGADQTQYQRRMNPKDLVRNYYVSNFKDYRFLQVFYPTRGILAWYSRAAGRLQPLPGADDPRYVHTNAVWSPDGKYLVFSRAEAKDAYQPGRKLAEFANDPNETQIQYDLYRIPFNNGEGGQPEPIPGASKNGMSNTFPKISPDGRWLVYVQCSNGQLMRPDSQLYIIPTAGGEARRMTSNTPLMNSWHSFSPNGRWLVFSSKSRSPYTQMFLTHLDEAGNDSPAILIENATAANRAVNIPEFVNIPQDGLMKIEAPATDYYRVIDAALELMNEGQYEAVIPEWRKALKLSPDEPLAHNNLGFALAETGKFEEAVGHYRRALELDPLYPEAHNNLGEALARRADYDEAIVQFKKALDVDPTQADARSNLGATLAQQGKIDEAIPHLEKAVEYQPEAAH
ncbi:MAG TPA: tetratricopeptide repeat protein, partial [Acidobacteriota bacterium]|nr:tetratricopeptide repeat protein [Acidobacteriota bacterium]